MKRVIIAAVLVVVLGGVVAYFVLAGTVGIGAPCTFDFQCKSYGKHQAECLDFEGRTTCMLECPTVRGMKPPCPEGYTCQTLDVRVTGTPAGVLNLRDGYCLP